ncbi:uncharacterized protein LOC135953691 [Calliphora vicina]|uniref:uncharacterized protein LOC135953691 n=1 Tax=Calliphora vicina TaxID=7373 RepID=UPI00325A5565
MDTSSNVTTPLSPDTCTSTSSTSSAPQYSEDIRRPLNALELLPRQGSGSSNKTCEVDLGDEERDTFSPVSSINNSPSEDHNVGSTSNIISADPCSSSSSKDNKHFEGPLPPLKLKLNNSLTNNLHPTPSKEEKQRQNEEIVILETSSISSETGSWESVFPQAQTTTVANNTIPQADVDLTNYCVGLLEKNFAAKDNCKTHKEEPSSSYSHLAIKNKDLECLEPLARERTYSAGHSVTADTSSLLKGSSTSSLQRDILLNKVENPMTASQNSACFIDASSLCDEDEVEPFKPSTQTHVKADDDSPTKKLETFHKAFARCKVKSKDLADDPNISSPPARPKSSSSCSSDDNEDNGHKNDTQLSNESVSNLSDEEKLWKRDHNNPSETENKLLEHHKNGLINVNDDPTEASVSLAHDVDSSDSSDLFKMRHPLAERKFTNFSYHTQNPAQYTALPLQHTKLLNTHMASSNQHNQTGAHSDVSYTTDYSSSSPAPSLVWSEHEHRSSHTAQQQQPSRLHLEDYEITKLKPHLLPDTPHNSIVHIEPNTSSNTSSIHRDYTLSSSSFSHHRDSGAYCSDATDSPVPMPRTPKRSKFDEANPIISGGSCIADYQPKKCDSPSLKRQIETCPIVSGGFTSLDFEPTRPVGDEYDEEVELRHKPKPRKPLSGIASWVVDMGDCQKERRKSTSSTSSLETSHSKFRERTDSNSSNKSGCNFFISLDDMDKKPKEKKPNTESQMSKSFNGPTNSKFFVNLSTSEYKAKEDNDLPNRKPVVKPEETSDNNSHNNIFSMFIDFGNGDKNGKIKPRKEPFSLAQRLSSSLTTQNQKKLEAESLKSAASSTETLMSKSNQLKNPTETEIANTGESKSLDFKVNLDPPITVAAIRRISMQQRAQHEANKRHSWSNNSNNPNGNVEYKRSISLTNNNDGKDNGSKGLMSIIDKLPIISKTSSLSIDSSLSPYDDYTGSKSELSTSSGGEREEEGSGGAIANRIKKRRRDVQINETFDKSSLASITDGILSKDLSPISTTDTDDLTFQQDEEQAAREAEESLKNLQSAASSSSQIPISTQNLASSSSSSCRMSNIIMETIVEAKETSSPKKIPSNLTMDSLQATIEKQKMLLETVNEHAEAEKAANNNTATTFVKLSDMDKPVKLDLKSPERMSTSVGGNHRQINRLYRDDNRARPHSWTMSRSTGNTFQNFTNSVENLRSLSRLFPNFSKEISNSLPNDMALDHMDYIQTDLSADSSLASSISRSGMDESSISCRQPRRLGEDLLKMFLQEIATDMIVEVHGRRIKAHKCILRSRCQYFAAMLAGNQSTSVVSLQGYSYSAVHFALCHIYSGASHPPDGISLMELAALADLLGLEGLKEVTAHALKTNYCHNFHKPCSGCIDGILQVLPVALNHALDDLYRKCLRWTCRHYLKVWPTRQFAQLPGDILGRCRQQIVAYLTSESVLDCVLDCDNLLAQLATYRWGGVCENLVRDILDAAYTYIAEHFASLIASDSFLSLGHDRSCHIPRLEGVLLRTASSLTPDQACRSYQRITRLNTVLQAKVIQMPAGLGELAKELQGLQEEDLDWDVEYIRLVSSLLSAVEQCLIRQCSRAMRVTAWQRMDLDLRKKIQTLARLTEPLDLKRGKPVSKAFSFGGSTRNQDLQQVKLAIQAHSKKALAGDTQLYKATQTHDAVQTTERGVQANHDIREGTSRVLKSNSRAHVPQSLRGISQSTVTTERNSANTNSATHRRTKSEATKPTTNATKTIEPKKPVESRAADSTTKPKPQPLKLADVRPRYLEPKKTPTTQGPVRSSTSSSIPASLAKKQNNYQQSSSESSRHSSPAARKHLNGKVAAIKSTNNMSLDSLASTSCRPARSKTNKSSDTERFSDIGVDSLNESMKSSVITNKTASRESLTSTRLARPKNIKADTSTNQNQKNKTVNGTTKPSRPTSLGPRAPKYLQQRITSTGSSPSSVTTTKSAHSRLSSVSSNQSSRDLYKRSISVPGKNDNPPVTKHSFLSAKSREILARRAEKEKSKQQEVLKKSQESQNSKEESSKHFSGHPVMRSASHSSVVNNRNGQPSNIPTRRPNTLHLKKTHAVAVNKTNFNQQQPTNNKNRTLQNSNEIYQTAQAVKQKIELLIKTSNHTANNENNDIDNHHQQQQQPSIVVASKLERSSTFCKDSADVDINELQIIE